MTARSRASLLDAFKPYLHERFNTGHTDAAALTTQITALGYRGSGKTVRRYRQPFRASLTAPAPVPVAPSIRQVTGWLTRHPDSLDEDERLQRKAILTRSPALTATARHVSEFAQMLTGRHGDRLQDWITDVASTDAPPLRSFANGLRHDLDAVTAGLTTDYSSGAQDSRHGVVIRVRSGLVLTSQRRAEANAGYWFGWRSRAHISSVMAVVPSWSPSCASSLLDCRVPSIVTHSRREAASARLQTCRSNGYDCRLGGHYVRSPGAVEGTVNRIKTIKRQMYGRASFDLLRKRILNPA